MAINQATYATPRADLAEAFREFTPRQGALIGPLVLPDLPQKFEAANLSVSLRENFLKRKDLKRRPGASYARGDISAEDLSYKCVGYGYEEKLPDENRAKYASDFDAEAATVEAAVYRTMLDREYRIAQAIFNATTWTGDDLYTDVANDWDDATNATPINDVSAAIQKVRANTGMIPTALIIGFKTYANLSVCAQILDRIKYTNTAVAFGLLPLSALAQALGVAQVLVGEAVYDTADEGLDFVAGDIWSDDYAMVAVLCPQGAPMNVSGVGRSVIWEPAGGILEVLSYRENQTKSDIFQVNSYVAEKILDPYFGHLLKIDS